MESLDFSEEEIQEQLASLGYSNISKQRLQEFKRDLDRLIRHEKSRSSTENTSPSSQTKTSKSPPALIKEKVQLNTHGPGCNYMALNSSSVVKQREILTSTFNEEDHVDPGLNRYYDSYSRHSVAQGPPRPSTAPNRLETGDAASDTFQSILHSSEATSPERDFQPHSKTAIKRKVLRKHQGRAHVCDESTHSEDSDAKFILVLSYLSMYKAVDGCLENESNEDDDSLSSSFWSDRESEEEFKKETKRAEVKTERNEEVFVPGTGNIEERNMVRGKSPKENASHPEEDGDVGKEGFFDEEMEDEEIERGSSEDENSKHKKESEKENSNEEDEFELHEHLTEKEVEEEYVSELIDEEKESELSDEEKQSEVEDHQQVKEISDEDAETEASQEEKTQENQEEEEESQNEEEVELCKQEDEQDSEESRDEKAQENEEEEEEEEVELCKQEDEQDSEASQEEAQENEEEEEESQNDDEQYEQEASQEEESELKEEPEEFGEESKGIEDEQGNGNKEKGEEDTHEMENRTQSDDSEDQNLMKEDSCREKMPGHNSLTLMESSEEENRSLSHGYKDWEESGEYGAEKVDVATSVMNASSGICEESVIRKQREKNKSDEGQQTAREEEAREHFMTENPNGYKDVYKSEEEENEDGKIVESGEGVKNDLEENVPGADKCKGVVEEKMDVEDQWRTFWMSDDEDEYVTVVRGLSQKVEGNKCDYDFLVWEREPRQKDEDVCLEDLHESLGSPAMSILTSGYGTYRPDSSKDGELEEGDEREDWSLAGLEENQSLLNAPGEDEVCLRNDQTSHLEAPAVSPDSSQFIPEQQTHEETSDILNLDLQSEQDGNSSENQKIEAKDSGSQITDAWDVEALRNNLDHPFNLRQRKDSLQSRLVKKICHDGDDAKRRKEIRVRGTVSELEERLDQMRVAESRVLCDSESDYTRSYSERSSSVTEESSCAFQQYFKGMTRSHSENDIRPQPKSFIRPVFSHPHTRNLKKNDPVTKYLQYKQDWEMFKAPGEKSRKELHWAIRPRPQKTYIPNTYVVPTEKKRSALRWEIRHDLAHGVIPAKNSYF
ncbi:hypothetical protein DNTS_031493 [Danionella cerebrum]|uniref:Centriolar and ciliogenesis-associated protein HYLS1 C-terminal domain-containing protein n=1 Tax=Danionella cerebrum TaxID=2873325 RepID=A0A553QDW0_9TELE|nr:hypothetical protein DNTS_031493 [Danionella translucida]